MDAFDHWRIWADKSLDDPQTIPAWLHTAVLSLPPEERQDRAKVNAAAKEAKARDETSTEGWQPASEEDHFMTCPTCGQRFDCATSARRLSTNMANPLRRSRRSTDDEVFHTHEEQWLTGSLAY
ncbi:hypothetical protein JQ544_25375 [Bradyrhizobium diazoefficiens]|nr:hypothetical protein [Bradyrhizobium diazoefficiens]MBR0814885.1 hypothetical protein [Bradyrhizobium diazoefficiens]